ncbi:hypothetical protein TeGR_g13547 [Tetraparma gracilis]|uniref:Clusterin-associated protein 1 n=1 Tax=Tetraparma gracilis TaxID=2962635 RepID=A0ABQ6N7Y2_9STRA|nr:hypothetical protein TeGR_g13547 [Tetraparma gracilis]
MRCLGYPRLISVENFKTPNFELVADCLYFMVRRYDPDIVVHEGIESEDDRVAFLKSVCGAMLARASIRLNPKKLYAADGHAVRELLKVATTLYDASRFSEGFDEDGGEGKEDDEAGLGGRPITSRLGDVKEARALASSITERGAKLHDLLRAEMTVRGSRESAIRFLEKMEGNLEEGEEQRHVEKSLAGIIEQTKEDVEKMKKQVDDFESDGAALTEKIARKTTDLERNKKRLANLQNVRPAFMDEYEKFEQDLVKQYTVYLERFRNLDYLEAELDSLNQAEKEKYLQSDRAMKTLQKKLREEELKLLRGDGDAGILGSDENAGSSGGKGLFGQRVERGGGLRDNSNGQGGGGRVKGKMGGGDSEESDSEDLSDEDLTHDTNDSDDVSEGDVSGSSDSSNIIENDSGSDSDDSSDGGGGGGDFQDDEDEDDLF